MIHIRAGRLLIHEFHSMIQNQALWNSDLWVVYIAESVTHYKNPMGWKDRKTSFRHQLVK